jgi:hypothetical protein
MSRVLLDSQLRTKLNGLTEQIEFCDESGKTVGHFVPDSMYRELLVAWSKAHMSDEEVTRRRAEPRGHTLAEIWKSLGQP